LPLDERHEVPQARQRALLAERQLVVALALQPRADAAARRLLPILRHASGNDGRQARWAR
jgi:hypothetical protein